MVTLAVRPQSCSLTPAQRLNEQRATDVGDRMYALR